MKNKATTHVNFLHVEPNSQFYTDLKQIETSLQFSPVDREYILVGIQNSIKQGYRIVGPEPVLAVGDIIVYMPKHDLPMIGRLISVTSKRFKFEVSMGTKGWKVKSTKDRSKLFKIR